MLKCKNGPTGVYVYTYVATPKRNDVQVTAVDPATGILIYVALMS